VAEKDAADDSGLVVIVPKASVDDERSSTLPLLASGSTFASGRPSS